MTRQRAYYFDGVKAVPIDPDVPGYDWAWNISGPQSASGPLTVRRAYNSVGHLQRVIGLRANAVATMPRHWYDTKTGEEIKEEELPWAEDFGDLLWRIESSLCVSGAAYLYRVLMGKRLASLRWFASSTITLKANADTGALMFERSLGTRRDTYTADQVAYVWQPDPYIEIGPGVAPAATALINAGVIRNISEYSSAFFERGAIAPTILSVSGNPSKDDKDRLRTWWRQVVGGIRNAFTSEVMTSEVKVTQLTPPAKDLAMPELSRQHKEDLATAMGIPYSMLFSDAANYATAKQDALTFYTSTVIPQANIIAEAFNEQICAALGVELYFAADELPMYQADEGERAKSLGMLTTAGMPLDIAIDALGYDLGDEAETRIRLDGLIKAGMSYDAARTIILGRDDAANNPRIIATLDALRAEKPLPEPSRPAEIGPTATPTPAPVMQPATTTPPMTMPMRSTMSGDLDKWQRKAAKALAAGKPASVAFESETIPATIAAAISGALEAATDADALRRVFRDAARSSTRSFYEQGDPNEGAHARGDDMRPINITVSPSIRLPDSFKMIPPVVTVNVPEQAAPVVNIAAPVVNVPEAAPMVVNVAAPVVNMAAPIVNVPEQPAPIVNVNIPRIMREDQAVKRDHNGNILSTTTVVQYEGE